MVEGVKKPGPAHHARRTGSSASFGEGRSSPAAAEVSAMSMEGGSLAPRLPLPDDVGIASANCDGGTEDRC